MKMFYGIVKARRDHQCTQASYHKIAKGDRYLRGVLPPWHECNDSGKYYVLKACLRCADHFGLHTSETRKEAES